MIKGFSNAERRAIAVFTRIKGLRIEEGSPFKDERLFAQKVFKKAKRMFLKFKRDIYGDSEKFDVINNDDIEDFDSYFERLKSVDMLNAENNKKDSNGKKENASTSKKNIKIKK